MARDDPTIYLRIPAELKEKIDLTCVESHRSFTAEVVARLEASFTPNIDAEGFRQALDHANELVRILASSIHAFSQGAADTRSSSHVSAMLETVLPFIEVLAKEPIAWETSSMRQAQNKVLDALRSRSTNGAAMGGTSYLAHVDEVISRRHEPEIALPTPNRGPTRSRNAGKPKVK